MLKQRIITALVLLPLVLGLLLATQLNFFAASIAVIVYLIGLEWAKLAGFKNGLAYTAYALAVTSVNLFIWYTSDKFTMWPSPSWPALLEWDQPMIVLGLAVAAIGLAIMIVLTYSRLPKWWSNLPIVSLIGLILLPAFFVSVISIRSIAYLDDFYRGGLIVLFMFCLIWAADTGAYITGKIFGKHKLAPIVSPNKTWEGALGGFCLSMLIAWTGAYLLNLEINNWLLYSLVAVCLAILSVIGDLFESALKRVSNIKDSGNLLPGHGGLLDRLDSTIVVAPIFFLSFSYFGWF